MSTITAVIGDTSSVGARGLGIDPTQVTARRNPQLATARIRTLIAPHIVQDAIGGFISADFTIPAEEALRWKPAIRYRSACWLFDGATPVFYGYLEQPVWTPSGDCQVTVSGPWTWLARTRTREAWEISDLSQLQRGSGAVENKNGQMNLGGDGTLTLSFANGTVLAASDRCSCTYLLFGEPVGSDDGRTITAFEMDISDFANLGANMRVRVIGAINATANGDQLWDSGAVGGSTGIQGAQNWHSANQGAAPWPNANGYRCLRFELVRITSGITLANDTYATLDRIRIGTREALFPAAGGTIDTAALARDIFAIKGTPPLGWDIPEPFWKSALNLTFTDTDTEPYLYGLDPITGTGTAPNSGVGVSGFSSLPWQAPADIIAELAAIDGNRAGFYIPYNARGGYDAPGSKGADVGSSWLSAPPQFYYQAWNDPIYSPDYVISARQGADVKLDTSVQPIADVMYTNHQTISGRQLSEVVVDSTTLNHAYAQGFRVADSFDIQPAVSAATATSLGTQDLKSRRQPTITGSLTITNTGATRNPVLTGTGSAVAHLATIRPGSILLTGVTGTSRHQVGAYATHIEYWAQTINSPEMVTLTLASPTEQALERRQAVAALRANRKRVNPLPA